MKNNYNHIRSFWGVFWASLTAARRNISGVVFGLVFPLIFILAFGFIGRGASALHVMLAPHSDTDNPIYQALQKTGSIKLTTDKSQGQIDAELKKGTLDGALELHKNITAGRPSFSADLTTSAAAPESGKILSSIVSGITDKINLSFTAKGPLPATFTSREIAGRKFQSIDFILPGQLGFSLLTSGIFATAFLFLTLKQTLVIKRFFTTPVTKAAIILGEAVSRLVFALAQASIIILVGKFFLGYTLINGWITFLNMLALSAIGLIVFLGFGFIVSSVAKDERTVPPFAQLLSLPQFVLAGTFVPIDAFPSWLQPISRVLPLTFLNDALRKVAFEGANLFAVRHEIGYLALWGVGVYLIAIKVFKWD